ncbi:MAG: hypothetical protein JXR25_11935 [Pontiellaceae bacterium]|nr:hypothetical protein [Pontiellaceae bacterium]MBN2785523.1 hypothetical protein [Pontiellaceae bacterium]
MKKRLAIVMIHYHLRPGGVTRVIERAVESLNDRTDILILTGEAPAPSALLTPITEPFEALGYSDHAVSDVEAVANDLQFTARSLLGRDPDVWHIHNHSLGKNSFTPQLVCQLARKGCRLLLQPHDFAEDGRPQNYHLLRSQLGDSIDSILYPKANHVWYAPINYRDKSFLSSIGLPQVHVLPNTVTPHEKTDVPAQENSRTVVYPARAIRRKNMGEFLLWSLLAPEEIRFQSTLAPQNPKWQTYYNQWVEFAKELALPVEFDAGRKHDFSKLIWNASALISTSIAEGFGLAFLEPWLADKMLIGRKLPEITRDFEEEGLDLSMMYDRLPIPIEWIGEAAFRKALESAMRKSYTAYSRPWNPDDLQLALRSLIVDGSVDFGVLDEALQKKVIRHLHNHPASVAALPEFNIPSDRKIQEHNRQLVLDRYGIDAYGNRLLGLYESLANTEPGPVSAAAASELMDCFLQPHRFNLLRT